MTRAASMSRPCVAGRIAVAVLLLSLTSGAALAQKVGMNCAAAGGTNCTALIPDPGSLVSTITVPAGACPSVARVCLAVGVEHSETSDLTVTLAHGMASAQILPGGSPDFVDAQVLEDTFDGLDGSGDWTLTVTDGLAGDYGALNNWALGLCCGAECGDGLVVVDAGAGITTEAGGTAHVSIDLTCPPLYEVGITSITSTDTTEGVPAVSAVTFTAQNWMAPQNVTVTGQDDSLLDGDIPYAVSFAGVTLGDPFDVVLPADLYQPPSIYAGATIADAALLNLDNEIDLAISKDLSGPPPTYTITATNQGPNTVNGATVNDTFPTGLECTWTCQGSNGGTCTSGPVTGNIDDLVDLPPGASVTYTAMCTGDVSGPGLRNTATIAGPTGTIDVDPDDNSGVAAPDLVPVEAPALDPWAIAGALALLVVIARRRFRRA